MNDNDSTAMDLAGFAALVERSSLGTPGAQELRRRTSAEHADRAVRHANDAFESARKAVPWYGLFGREKHAACLVAAQAGDRRALDVLVADLTPLVWHVIRSHGVDKVTAEDLVQEVWLTWLRSLDKLIADANLAGWLITTSRRVYARWRRSNPTTATHPVRTDLPNPDDQSLGSDRDRALWAAFNRLPKLYRELLALTVLAGRASYDVVAETLAIPEEMVGPMRSRALAMVRTLMDGSPAAERPPRLTHALGRVLRKADPVPARLILSGAALFVGAPATQVKPRGRIGRRRRAGTPSRGRGDGGSRPTLFRHDDSRPRTPDGMQKHD